MTTAAGDDCLARERVGAPVSEAGRYGRMVDLGAPESDEELLHTGDYFASGRSLYRVEHLAGRRVLIGDRRSGQLLDLDRDACAALKRVKRVRP